MLLLSFETSAKACSVALSKDGRLLAEAYENTGLTHSQTLMTMAGAMLESSGFTPGQVEGVAAAAGPGSFTGVRIGVAAAKGFAWGAQLPCYGVSTLESMALGFGAWEGTVVCVMDARRNQVYNALFAAKGGVVTRLCEDRAISLEELAAELETAAGPLYLVGDGSHVCHKALSPRLPNLILPPEHRLHQRAAGVALAAEKMIAAGDPGDAAALQPNYLRLSQAERERLENQCHSVKNR